MPFGWLAFEHGRPLVQPGCHERLDDGNQRAGYADILAFGAGVAGPPAPGRIGAVHE